MSNMFSYFPYLKQYLTVSPIRTKPDTFANNTDPDEMAHNEPSHVDLPFCFDFVLTPLFFILDMPKFIDGRVQLRN